MQVMRAPTAEHTDWLARGTVAGFTATMMMLFAFVSAYGLAAVLTGSEVWSRIGLPTVRGWLIGLTENPLISLAQPNLPAAVALHFAVGLGFALLFARVVHPRLSGPSWWRGLVFSLLPWLLSLLVFLPLVGGGLLGFGLGAGPLPIIGNLILHAFYGVTLGALYGPLGSRIVESGYPAPSDEDIPAMQHAGRATAAGIIAGLVLGVGVGLLVVLLVPMGAEGTLLHLHPLVFVVTAALLGATWGAFIGSLMGLGVASEQV